MGSHTRCFEINSLYLWKQRKWEEWTKGRRATVKNSRGHTSSQISLSHACWVMWLTEPMVFLWVTRAKMTSFLLDTIFSTVGRPILVACSQQILGRVVRSISEKAEVLMTFNCFLADFEKTDFKHPLKIRWNLSFSISSFKGFCFFPQWQSNQAVQQSQVYSPGSSQTVNVTQFRKWCSYVHALSYKQQIKAIPCPGGIALFLFPFLKPQQGLLPPDSY